MGKTCDPVQKLGPGVRGQRKRETIEAFAWLLERVLLPQVRFNLAANCSCGIPTIIDAGCSTGSLLLPLAFAFPDVHFVGVDLKSQSLVLLEERARACGLSEARVSTCECRIEDYDGPCDAIVSLCVCPGRTLLSLPLLAPASHGLIHVYAYSPCAGMRAAAPLTPRLNLLRAGPRRVHGPCRSQSLLAALGRWLLVIPALEMASKGRKHVALPRLG